MAHRTPTRTTPPSPDATIHPARTAGAPAPALRATARLSIGLATVLALLTIQPGAASAAVRAATHDRTATLAGSFATDITVEQYLAAYPGGTILNTNEISYSNGTFVVTLKPETPNAGARAAVGVGPLAVVDCPSGWFCFYDRPNYGYPRGKLSDCYWQSLATWGWQDRIESVYYAINSGSVQFFDYNTALYRVGVGSRAIANVYPLSNRATDVYRYC